MKIVILDYGSGNTKSIQFAIKRLGYDAILSNDISKIKAADKIIFPGVGAANSAMQKLRSTTLDVLIPTLQQPVLGICLGMQLLCKTSEEGSTKGLGIFDVDVVKFTSEVKVPQVGWNTISNLKGPLFTNISEKDFMYTVHSYYAPICPETVAVSTYGFRYAAALQKENFYGTQFHPEKSGTTGATLLKNFITL